MLLGLFVFLYTATCWNICIGQKPDNNNFQKRVQYDSQGRLQYFPKAVHGSIVRKGEFKNFVSIQTKTGSHICGATMLDVDFIITTASCLTKSDNKEPYTTSELQVMNDALQNETVKLVNQIFRHPDFDPTTLDNDVAILNIQPFKWSNDVEMLTAIDKPSNSAVCEVIGWGENENSDPFLQKIMATITDEADCVRQYSYDTPNQLCIQGQNGSCIEEPGSGLVCDEELTGILSYGNDCSQMVYTDLTKYNVWIDEVFRTVITQKSHDSEQTDLESKPPTSTTITTTVTTTTEAPKPQSYTTPSVSQYSTPPTPVQSDNNGHWAYQVVLDTCQLSFVTCEPVWSSYQFDVQCKRGYFPYGCFHVVKKFVKDEPSGRSMGSSQSNRLTKFMSYLKQKPLKKVQKAVENIFDTEKVSRAGFQDNPEPQKEVILTPWNHWFQRIFCMPVAPFKHYNNFPQQWRSDCDHFQPHFRLPIRQPENRGTFQEKSIPDSRIYFPDSDF